MKHKSIIILSLALLLLIGVDYLNAWTAPTANPPSGNVAAPIHTGPGQQVKNGDLGVNNLSVVGLQQITSNTPTIAFTDTDNRNFGLHVNSDTMFILGDRNDDGNWTTDYQGAWPMQMGLGATPAQDYVRFSNHVRADRYCDTNGGNCWSPTTGAPGGAGTWGTWQNVSRTPRTWYQNTEITGIAVHYHTNYNARFAYVSPTASMTGAVVVSSPDGDSGEWGPGFFIVPPGQYYYIDTISFNRFAILKLPF